MWCSAMDASHYKPKRETITTSQFYVESFFFECDFYVEFKWAACVGPHRHFEIENH